VSSGVESDKEKRRFWVPKAAEEEPLTKKMVLELATWGAYLVEAQAGTRVGFELLTWGGATGKKQRKVFWTFNGNCT